MMIAEMTLKRNNSPQNLADSFSFILAISCFATAREAFSLLIYRKRYLFKELLPISGEPHQGRYGMAWQRFSWA